MSVIEDTISFASTGKHRRLKRLQGEDGFFAILAVDHKTVFAHILEQSPGSSPADGNIVPVKMKLVDGLSLSVSAVLADPVSAKTAVLKNVLPTGVGLIIGIEGDDYSTSSFSEQYLMPGMDAAAVLQMGGDCVKLFLYYHPYSQIAGRQNELIQSVSADCLKMGIPFLLEPVLYDPGGEILAPEAKVKLMSETAANLSRYPIDLYKIEFPGDIGAFSDKENIELCRKLTETIPFPWILLSSGIDGGALKTQLELACRGGATGFAVGRTLWKSYLLAAEEEKEQAMLKMRGYLEELSNIVKRYAKL